MISGPLIVSQVIERFLRKPLAVKKMVLTRMRLISMRKNTQILKESSLCERFSEDKMKSVKVLDCFTFSRRLSLRLKNSAAKTRKYCFFLKDK